MHECYRQRQEGLPRILVIICLKVHARSAVDVEFLRHSLDIAFFELTISRVRTFFWIGFMICSKDGSVN